MTRPTRYHLIGIGGAGMSAIACVLHGRGDTVTGSDRQESQATSRLRAMGVRVGIGHDARFVDGAQVVVYTPAIASDNPELMEARRQGLEIVERPAMLGRLMEPYKHRVAVAGAHGKTTTTSMIAAILHHAGVQPTAFIGGDVSFLHGNAALGKGEIVVAEACEAFGSFLHLKPSIAVVTNVDADHLDYYGTLERVHDAFREFLSGVDKNGCVVACADDPPALKIAGESERNLIAYGIRSPADVSASDVRLSGTGADYQLVHQGRKLQSVRLSVPGEHNVLNSLAAASVALELSVSPEDVRRGLGQFCGAGRRFEVLCRRGGVTVVDDYAHHPAEIVATLNASRSAHEGRIIAIFQPHLYSRTLAFLDEFAEALSHADEVTLIPIYAAREEPIDGVSSERIAEKLRDCASGPVRYVEDVASLPRDLVSKARGGDMLLFMGAGDIRETAEKTARILIGEPAP